MNFIRSLLNEVSVIGDVDVVTMVVGGVIGGSVVHCSQQPRQVKRGPPLRDGGVGLSKVAGLFDFPNLRSWNANLTYLAKFYSIPFIVGKKGNSVIQNMRLRSQQIVLCTTYLYWTGTNSY